MKTLLSLCSVTFTLLLCFGSILRADTAEEQQQIAVLQQPASSLQEKDAACARLKRIGTVKSVPTLAALLADEQLSHSARFALESMPLPEAGRALLAALDQTHGPTRAGVVNSLGNRRETNAVPALAKLLWDPDATIGAPAAVALGKVGNPAAVAALRSALPGATQASHAALVDALLRSANLLLAAGDRAAAANIFRQLHQPKEKEFVRAAAYEGLIQSAGERALNLVIAGIEAREPADQGAALRLARDLKDPATSKALAALLPKSAPPVQMALLGALGQRGDAAAGPAVLAMMKSQDPEVRLAAISALAEIGDASAVPLLAAAAASANEAEQKAARQSLLELRHGNNTITKALTAQTASAAPALQVELIRALAGRAEKSAVPQLLELARNGAEAPRAAAVEALGLLAGAGHVAPLVQLVLSATTDSARSEAGQALATVCERAQAKPGFDVGPIVGGLADGRAEVRIALLPLCRVLVEPRIRAVLRSAVADSDERVRRAALQALCEARDPELLPDLLALASADSESNFRTLALRGYVRLATDERAGKFSQPERAGLLKPVLIHANSIEDKRLILGGLAGVPASDALQLVLPFLESTEVRAEAEAAATRIAGALGATDANLARSALNKVLAVTADPGRRQAAEAILKQIDGTRPGH